MDNFITLIISTITGVITYVVGHRKAKKEVESLSLTNIEKSLDIYNIIINDLKSQVAELLNKVDDLENKIDELKAENAQLKEMLRKK